MPAERDVTCSQHRSNQGSNVEKMTQPLNDEISEMQSRIDELEREVEDLKQANWQQLSNAEKDPAHRNAQDPTKQSIS